MPLITIPNCQNCGDPFKNGVAKAFYLGATKIIVCLDCFDWLKSKVKTVEMSS